MDKQELKLGVEYALDNMPEDSMSREEALQLKEQMISDIETGKVESLEDIESAFDQLIDRHSTNF